jgi:O-antigen/teichoic acid export membrane protein
MQILNQLLNLIGIYFFYKIGYSFSLLAVSLICGLSSLLVNIIFSIILFVKHKEVNFHLRDFDLGKVKQLSSLGVQFFIIQIAAMIIFTTDNIIITNLFGPDEVTPYNLTYKIFSIIIMLNGILITPIWSISTQAYAEKDFSWLRKLIKYMNIVILCLIIAGFLIRLFFNTIIDLWIGQSYSLNISTGLINMMFMFMCLNIWNNLYSNILSGISKIKLGVKVTVMTGLLNIPLSIYFAKNLNYGVTGVIMATNICLSITAIISPIQVFYFIYSNKKSKLLDKILS